MAKRSVVHKPKKLQPAELTFNFRLPTHSEVGNSRQNLDLSQVASLLNRRFYRQGLAWAVAGFTLHTNALASQIGSFTVRKLPTTWVMSNAWEKGFRTWKKMNDDALEGTESVRPRFMDFKIYADTAHHQNGFENNMLPFVKDSAGAFHIADPGEWEASTMEIPDNLSGTGASQHREIIAVGANYPGASVNTGLNAVSLVEGYSNSRSLPAVNDPHSPVESSDVDGSQPQNWIAAVSNEGIQQTEDVLEALTTENNQAPYPFEGGEIPPGSGAHWAGTQYPAGPDQLPSLVMHDQVSVSVEPQSFSHSRRTIPGGVFPCGLIQFSYSSALNNAILQVHLVPGEHRGYMAKPMTDL